MVKELTFPFNLSGRPAIYFVQAIQDATLNLVQIGSPARRVNAKSLLGVLSLGINSGDTVSIFYKEERDFKVMEEIINFIKEEF